MNAGAGRDTSARRGRWAGVFTAKPSTHRHVEARPFFDRSPARACAPAPPRGCAGTARLSSRPTRKRADIDTRGPRGSARFGGPRRVTVTLAFARGASRGTGGVADARLCGVAPRDDAAGGEPLRILRSRASWTRSAVPHRSCDSDQCGWCHRALESRAGVRLLFATQRRAAGASRSGQRGDRVDFQPARRTMDNSLSVGWIAHRWSYCGRPCDDRGPSLESHGDAGHSSRRGFARTSSAADALTAGEKTRST